MILFVGDGMSQQTQTAARILKAQYFEDNFIDPESQYLSFERLPHTGHSKVGSVQCSQHFIRKLTCCVK